MSGDLLLRGYRRINRRKPRSINNQGIQRKETPHFPKVAKFVRGPQCLAFSIFNFKDMGLTPWGVKPHNAHGRRNDILSRDANAAAGIAPRNRRSAEARFVSDFAPEPVTLRLANQT
jgi:hypothetical protein